MNNKIPNYFEWIKKEPNTTLSPIYNQFGDDTILDSETISELLGVSQAAVRNWINKGRLPSINPGGHHRVRGRDLKEFLFARDWKNIRKRMDR